MRGYANAVIVGNVVQNPKILRVGDSEKVVFSLAVNHDVNNVSYIEVESWLQVETIAKNFTKGRMVLVEGSIHVDKWVDNETKSNRSKQYIKLRNFIFLDRKIFSESKETSDSSSDSSESVATEEKEVEYEEIDL